MKKVFTSPEIAMLKTFNDDVLRHPSFFQKLCLLAIDEIHLVSEWREFRPEYFNLGVIRARLPAGIPLLGASATLDQATLKVVKDRCAFDPNHAIVKTSLDRPEIYMQITAISYPTNSMLDLQRFLPSKIKYISDVPKTIIFMDSINNVVKAGNLVRSWMKDLSYPSGSDQMVGVFFADMATRDKEIIAARFGVESDKCTLRTIQMSLELCSGCCRHHCLN